MADLLFENHFLIVMLENFDIQLGVGDKTVHEVCVEKGINTDVFLTFAALYEGTAYHANTALSIEDMPVIVAYLRNCHRYYLDEKYPKLKKHLQKMLDASTRKESKLVERFLTDYIEEVTEHINYENNIVFPYVTWLCGQLFENMHTENPIDLHVSEYKEHHNEIEDKLHDLKNVLIKYLPFDNDRLPRRKLIEGLFELSYDLNVHSLIEDSILIPLVEKAENALKAKQ